MQAELVVSGTAGASITTWEPQDGGTDYVATIHANANRNRYIQCRRRMSPKMTAGNMATLPQPADGYCGYDGSHG